MLGPVQQVDYSKPMSILNPYRLQRVYTALVALHVEVNTLKRFLFYTYETGLLNMKTGWHFSQHQMLYRI
jgi:hypothetical protein